MLGRFRFFSLSLLLIILGCNPSHKGLLSPSTGHIIEQAYSTGFAQEVIATNIFLLTSFQKLSGTANTATPGTANSTAYVFIEGDGRSWKTKYKLSNNPTPRQPLALKLAVLSAKPTVGVLASQQIVYLARPCQYTPHQNDKNCLPKYWSSHRYAEEVISSMSEALTQIKTKAHNQHFVLIGFSGGASVAALIAARRNDVVGLITIAGDLDNQALSIHHGTTPLYGSLNPMNIAASLKQLPQAHWSGKQDKVVPTWIAERFVKQVNGPCAQHYVLPKVEHHQGWDSHVNTVLSTNLSCSKT